MDIWDEFIKEKLKWSESTAYSMQPPELCRMFYEYLDRRGRINQDDETPAEFIGKKVTHHSGRDPIMVVAGRREGGQLVCTWTDKDGQAWHSNFLPDDLEEYCGPVEAL